MWNQFQFDDRFEDAYLNQSCFISVDGVDCPINEPNPFDRGYYSHKLKHAGLRYEIGVCIRTGNIVWCNGGFRCGNFSDLAIARQSLIPELEQGEKIIADNGYKDRRYFINKFYYPEHREKIQKILARHENINGKFKRFTVIHVQFRHGEAKHIDCFYSVVNIIALAIKFGFEELTFSVE